MEYAHVGNVVGGRRNGINHYEVEDIEVDRLDPDYEITGT